MNLERDKVLENSAKKWVGFCLGYTNISYTEIYSKNKNNKLFEVTIDNKKYVLIIRLERDSRDVVSELPRSEKEILREVLSYNSCNVAAPKLVNYNSILGALLFEAIDQEYTDASSLLREANQEQAVSILEPALVSLSEIHHVPIVNKQIYSALGNDTYSYINYHARKIDSEISLPDYKSGNKLLHGNANPGNWIQLKGRGFWLDFEDSHIGMPEFDFGYLLGHLRAMKSDSIMERFFLSLNNINSELNNELILRTSKVVSYYIKATEALYNRYALRNIHMIKEDKY